MQKPCISLEFSTETSLKKSNFQLRRDMGLSKEKNEYD